MVWPIFGCIFEYQVAPGVLPGPGETDIFEYSTLRKAPCSNHSNFMEPVKGWGQKKILCGLTSPLALSWSTGNQFPKVVCCKVIFFSGLLKEHGGRLEAVAEVIAAAGYYIYILVVSAGWGVVW